ncbi:MAG: S-layer homology domain-containing protein [Clostridia bacterium]|nr:S-layer homology domain-containing protein [Clostridia bacterium]
MKTFKRISAIVISLAMIMSCAFSSVVFAAEMNDVTTDNPYYKAIMDLVGKGIINGYQNEDGTYSFKSDGNITRAEFCAIISRADAPTGYNFVSTKSSFTDVAADNWASPYVEYAVSRKIVNGMGDGIFAPNDPVTYAQAIKMIVCALNYGYAAEATTPWYNTYLEIANALKLTKNAFGSAELPAIRGLVAQLVYNMNNTAPAVQTGVDENGNPKYSAGSGTYEEQTKGTQELEGQLIAVFRKALNGNSDGVANNQVKLNYNGTEVLFNIGAYSMDDLAEFLGYEVNIAYSEDDSGRYVIERISKTSSNEVYFVEDIDINKASVTTSSMEYYDENSRNGIAELDFADDMKVLVNGGAKASGWVSDLQLNCGNITFIDYNDDGNMDVAFVKSYTNMYVKSVTKNKNAYTVYDKFAGTNVTFNEDTQNITVKVANNNSDTLADGTLASIATNNIISYAINDDDVEIIVSKKTASGSSSTSEVKGLNDTAQTVTFGNKEFVMSDFYLNNIDNATYPQVLSVGDVCSVYLDFTGKIAAVDKKEVAVNYGYIINVAAASNDMDSDTYEVLLYNNGIKKLIVSKTGFKINGSPAEPADLVTAVTNSATTVNAQLASDKKVNAEKAVLVKYELANNGQLKAVTTLDSANTVMIADAFSYSSNVFTKSPDKITINDTTKVFLVPKDRTVQSSYKMGKGNLTNGETYYAHAFDIENNIAKAVVVYGQDVKIKPTAETILVKKILSKNNSANEPVQELTYDTFSTVGGESKTVLTKESTTLDGVEPGDIIKVLLDGGVVEKVLPIFDSSELTIYSGAEMTNNYGAVIGDGRVKYAINGDNTYYVTFGTVALSPAESKGNGIMEVKYIGAEDAEVTQTYVNVTDAVVYSYDGDATDNEFFLKASRDAIYDEVGSESKVLVISKDGDGTYKGIIIYE